MDARADKTTKSRGGCPICGAPSEAAVRPFCSRRCADVDLSRWLRGAYAIPAQSADDEEDEAEAAGGQAYPAHGAGQPDRDEL